MEADAARPEAALAVCNLFQYSAMMADKAAGANYKNYLNLCRGDTAEVVSFMARISSVSSLVTFVLGPRIGALSDRLGRKPVLVGTQLAMAACWYWRNALTYPSIRIAVPCVLAVRWTNGLCYNSFMANRVAALADVYSGSKLALAQSYLSASMGLAYLVGPLLLTPLVGKSIGAAFRARWMCAAASALVLQFGLAETNAGAAQARRGGRSARLSPKSGTATNPNPISFLTLFRRSSSLAWFTLAQAMQKLSTPTESLSSVTTFHIQQVLQWNPIEYGRILMVEGFSWMCGSRFTKKLLPLLGDQRFVLMCNVAAALAFGLRALARDCGRKARALFLLSLVPMLAANQKCVVVDAAAVDAAVASGMGRGECSAALANINAVIYIVAPPLWASLYKKYKFLPFYCAAGITLASQIPYYLGKRAAANGD
jgi:DHA1 family tetracycline resistance protein-like MFS transporter